MSQPSGSAYLHGTSAAEQGRLALLNDLLNRRSLAELGLRGGELRAWADRPGAAAWYAIPWAEGVRV